MLYMDLQRQLRLAIDTGDVAVGFKESMKSVKTGKAKLLILASNSTKEFEKLSKEAKASKVLIYRFRDSNIDLGVACGRRHPVSVLAVKKLGDSEILDLIKGE